MSLLVKQKRPSEIARFLRLFAVEDRHEVTNLLMTLGLQSFHNERHSPSRCRSPPPHHASDTDESYAILRQLRETVQSTRGGKRSSSPRQGRSVSPRGRQASVDAVQRQHSPRCASCRERRTDPAGQHSSPPLRDLIEQDKRIFRQRQLESERHLSQDSQRAEGSSVNSNAVWNRSTKEEGRSVGGPIIQRSAVASLDSKPTASLSSVSKSVWALDAIPTTEEEGGQPETSQVRSGSAESNIKSAPLIPQFSHPVTIESNCEHSISKGGGSNGGGTSVTGTFDVSSLDPDMPDSMRQGGQQQQQELEDQQQGEDHPTLGGLSPPSSASPHPPVIPAESLRALWEYIEKEKGARRNPLVVAAAMPSEYRLLAMQQEFQRAYSSLLLAYHMKIVVE